MVLNILLVTKKGKFLSRYVSSYFKGVDTQNTLKWEEKTCRL